MAVCLGRRSRVSLVSHPAGQDRDIFDGEAGALSSGRTDRVRRVANEASPLGVPGVQDGQFVERPSPERLLRGVEDRLDWTR